VHRGGSLRGSVIRRGQCVESFRHHISSETGPTKGSTSQSIETRGPGQVYFDDVGRWWQAGAVQVEQPEIIAQYQDQHNGGLP
jgi:hypothetical protein